MASRIKKTENVLKNLFEEEIVTPEDILIALHNVCSHGRAIEDVGGNVTDEHLGKLFEGFEISMKAMRKMME